MPLHDWTDQPGFDGVHQIWIVELLYWVKPRLPDGFRAYLGTTPTFAFDTPPERPDVGVRNWPPPENGSPPESDSDARSGEEIDEPDQEIAVMTLEGEKTLFIENQGWLVAAVEIVSPRNKDRPSSRAGSVIRYEAYLRQGVNLLLVDVHRRPLRFSLAEVIAGDFGIERPPCPTPFAISYRVGEPAPDGGRFLAIWQRPLAFGAPLPKVTLPLTVHQSVRVDLEHTYARAAAASYLEE